MDSSKIKHTLRGFISTELLGGMEIASEDELLLTDLLDSLGVMRLVAFMEETWSVTVQPEDVVLETMQNVDAMTAYLIDTHKVAA